MVPAIAANRSARRQPPALETLDAGPFRLAHLTDIHIQPERKGREGTIACLKHLRSLDRKPALVVTGGDLVMDAFGQSLKRTKELFDMFSKVFSDGCSHPIEHTMGNHDIWGWAKSDSGTKGDEPGWGKKYFKDALGVTALHRAISAGGWKLVILDSVQPGEAPFAYTGGLDDEQFEWLKGELAATPATTPILCVSHIPILGGGVVMADGRLNDRGILVEKPTIFKDALRVVDLFSQHPNVKLCVSGHIHIVEKLEFQGVTYYCGGAVSGAWWKTPEADRTSRAKKTKDQSPPAPPRPLRSQCGYSTIDLWPDGRFETAYQAFGWNCESDSK